MPLSSEQPEALELGERLGTHALTELFDARSSLGRLLVHVPRPELTSAREKLPEIAALLQRFRHEALLEWVDAGTLPDGRPFLAYVHQPGADLAALAEVESGLPPELVVAAMVPVCRALEFLHANGCIHGALQAASIWMCGGLGGAPRLAHLGLVLALPKPDLRETVDGPPPVLGCAPPEVIEGQPADARSDVYLVGAAIHEALTGAPLFAAANVREQLLSHLSATPPALPERAAHLQPVVARALAKLPADRFGSMAELREALENAQHAREQTERAARAAAQVGEVLGSYELVSPLGQGSMGQVFLARHTRLGRQVAIKVLRPEHAADEALVTRFFHEAQAVNQINHDHIVQISDFIQEPPANGRPGRVYCVMELLTGKSLSAALAEAPMPLSRVLPLLSEVASALEAAHRRGVIHRDVKPDNIFVVEKPDGRMLAKVLDFGVAKLSGPQATVSSTQVGALVGTPTYMSPEQAASLEVDARSDIYALATVLYEALAGAPPFRAQAFGKLVAEIITQPAPPLPAKTPGGEPIPPSLRELVMRCLDKDPTARVQTMGELTSALVQLARGEPVQISPARPRSRKGLAAAALTLLVVMAALLLARHRAPVSAPVPVAVAQPALRPALPPPPPKPEPPPPVHVRISSTPPGASVVDAATGESWGVTPLSRELVRGAADVSLRLELAGYRAETRDLRPNADADLEIALVPLRVHPTAAAQPKRVKKPVSENGTVDPFGGP